MYHSLQLIMLQTGDINVQKYQGTLPDTIAVSDNVQNLNYLIRMIRKKCGGSLTEIHCHTVKEVIKDVYGGVNKYGQLSVSDSVGSDGTVSECACEGEAWEPTEIQDVPDEGDAGDSFGGT